MAATFVIRPASSAVNDGDRVVSFLDSQLPWLVQQGAEGQWGATPFSSNDEILPKYRMKVKRSETTSQTWNHDWIKTYIAEVEEPTADFDGSHDGESREPVRLPVAAMILAGSSPVYTHGVIPAQDEKDLFLYVSLVVSDRSVGALGRGSGKVLLDHAKNVAQSLGLRRLCLDCWNGNGRRLVKFYECQGFEAIGDLVDPEDGWSGTVLEISLTP